MINFDYYDSHEFHSCRDIVDSFLSCDSFSAVHCNVRSLSADDDSLLICFSSELYFPFSLIGLSEANKQQIDKDAVSNA